MSYNALNLLSTRQAIEYLKNQKAITLTEEDIISFCSDEHCRAFVRTYGRAGLAEDTGEEVFAIGHQQLLNPDYVNAPGDDIELALQGDVRTWEHDYFGHLIWTLKVRKSDVRLLFLRSDLDALASAIKKSTDPAPERLRQNHLLIIARMLEIILKETTKRTQERIVDDLIDTYPSIPGMKDRTIKGIFAEANKAKKELGLPPSP